MYFASISQFKKNRFSFQKGAGELQVVFKYCNIQIASSQLRTVFPGYAGRTRFQKTLPFQEVAVAICFPFLSPRMASLSVHLSRERRQAEPPKPLCRSMSKRYNFFSYLVKSLDGEIFFYFWSGRPLLQLRRRNGAHFQGRIRLRAGKTV